MFAPRQLSNDLGRAILSVLVAVGVLVGLLAMHTISSASSDHLTKSSSMNADSSSSISGDHGDHGVMTSPNKPQLAADCGGMCNPAHTMTNMACVLALLFSTIVIAIAASRRWSTLYAELHRRWLSIVAVAAAATPPPPDLIALSISRT